MIAPPELFAAATGTVGNDETAHRRLGRPALRAARGGVLHRRSRSPPGDAFYLGFAGQHSPGRCCACRSPRRSRASASTRATRRWCGRSGPARRGSRAPVHADTTGGLNRNGHVLLHAVPMRSRAADPRRHPRLLAARRLIRASAGPADLPDVAPVRARCVADALGGTVPAEHASTIAGEIARPQRRHRPARSSRVSRPPVLPRREGELVRVIDHRRRRGLGRGRATSPRSRPGRPPRHLGRRHRHRPLRPAVRYADGSIRQHGAIPRDGARDRRHRVPPRRRAPTATSGAGTLTVLRTTIPYIDRVEQPGAGDRRRRRRDRRRTPSSAAR